MDIIRNNPDLQLALRCVVILVAAPVWVGGAIWALQNPIHWLLHDFLGAMIDPVVFQVLIIVPATVAMFGAIFLAPLLLIPDRLDPNRGVTAVMCMAHPVFAMAPAWLLG